MVLFVFLYLNFSLAIEKCYYQLILLKMSIGIVKVLLILQLGI